MNGRLASAVLICLLATVSAGCGSSSPKRVQRPAAATLTPTRLCLRRHGYRITPDSAAALRTAPSRFDFIAVWNLVPSNGIALALAISRSVAGATRAAVWTRREHARLYKGLVAAPVVRYGRIDALWTAKPGRRDVTVIRGCLHSSS